MKKAAVQGGLSMKNSHFIVSSAPSQAVSDRDSVQPWTCVTANDASQSQKTGPEIALDRGDETAEGSITLLSEQVRESDNSLESFQPGWWLVDSLPLLDGIGPLLPGACDKRPLVGNGWEEHPGLSIDQLQAAAPECVCWHVGADPRRIGIDIDGEKAAVFCQRHGCDPYTADTWRIVRTSNSERLKLVFTVTPQQKATLVGGGKTVKIDGQELAVFAKPGTQIVVLGQHYTKESNYTENDDQYAWAGRQPADAQPLPSEWFELLTGVLRRAAAETDHEEEGIGTVNPQVQRLQQQQRLEQQQPEATLPCVRKGPFRRLQHQQRSCLVLSWRNQVRTGLQESWRNSARR
jgi:hypothetical protein